MRDASPLELEKFWASQVQADISPAHRWECLGPTNIAGRVTALSIHPKNPKQWFAGSATGGVWVSNDEGESWSPTWSRFANQNIGALGWLENKQLIGGLFLFVATGEANMTGESYPGSGIYQSSDSGLTWQPTFGPPIGVQGSIDQDVRTFPRRIGGMALRNFRLAFASVFLDNSLPASLYLADLNVGGRGLYPVEYWGRRSYNCHCVLMHPEDEKILYVSIEPDGTHNGIWRSPDFGNTWVHLTKGLPSSDQFRRTSLAFAPSDPNVIYALAADRRSHVLGVFRSTNGGNSWREILGGRYPKERQMSYNNVIAVHPREPDSVVWGGAHLYRTDDAGGHWRRISNGDSGARDYVHSDHHALLWPEDDLIISGNDGGVAVSRDGGHSWGNKSRGMITTMFYGLDVAPTDGNIFAGGTQDNGILVAGVEGKTGANKGNLIPAVPGDGAWVAFSGTNANEVFACVTPFLIYHHRPGKPWEFKGWNLVKPRRISQEETAQRAFTVMAIEPSAKSGMKTVWAGSTRLWRTTDNGKRWRVISPTFDGTPISAIAISRGKKRVMFVGTTGGGIFRSEDGGLNWSQTLSSVDIPERAITDIQFHPKFHGTVVATVASSGIRSSGVDLQTGGDLPYGHVFRSEDFGDTWKDIDNGKLPNVVYYAAAYQSAKPYRLFIAGDVGVWAEIENEWVNISGNLPNVVVSDLVYHDKGGTLTAATYGRGVWRMKLANLGLAPPVVSSSPPEQIDVAPGLRVDPSVSAPVLLTPAEGSVIDDPQRKTVVTVQPVPNARGYQGEIAAPGILSMAFSSASPEIVFMGLAPGKGQWRVWAILPDGSRSPASPWRNIVYSR